MVNTLESQTPGQSLTDADFDALSATVAERIGASEAAIAAAQAALAEDRGLLERYGLRPESGRRFLEGMGPAELELATDYLAIDRAEGHPDAGAGAETPPHLAKPRMRV